MKNKSTEISETSREYRRARRLVIRKLKAVCTYCSPHGGENRTRTNHGTRKSRRRQSNYRRGR